MIAVKITNLPFDVTLEKIYSYFDEYDFVPKSVVLGQNKYGKFNGRAAILMKDS